MKRDEVSSSSFYDVDASTYDSRWRNRAGATDSRDLTAIVVELLGAERTAIGLELGSGTGRFSPLLARLVDELHLVDISAEMLSTAERKLANEAGEVRVSGHQGSAYEIPLADATVDVVLTVNMLSHIDEPARVFAETARVLRSGGSFIFTTTNLRSVYAPAGGIANRRGKAFGQEVASAWHKPTDIEESLLRNDLHVTDRVGHFYVPRSLQRFGIDRLLTLAPRSAFHRRFASIAPMHAYRCVRT
ncbi:MAG: class I SAM-dependent methyltransferase [Actinomycetota bacterium]